MDFPAGCPVCGGDNGGRGCCPPCSKTVDRFRRLFRNLQQWWVLYEVNPELEIIPSSDGREWSIWDVQRLYDYRTVLPDQQRKCIELFLYENYYERDTAAALGVGRGEHTSVAIYATVGLIKLLSLAREGQLRGVDFDFDVDMLPLVSRETHPVTPIPAPQPEPAPVIEIYEHTQVLPLVTVHVHYTTRTGHSRSVRYPLQTTIEEVAR